MAKRKTTELTTITAASLAAGDWFPVVDVSDTTDSPTGTNKKIAKSELAEAAGVTAHLALGTDAHDASAISFSATGNIAATDVQAAIAELALTVGPGASTTCVALTDGATVTLDASLGRTFRVTLGGNRTLAITNPTDGRVIDLEIKQDGSGARTLTLPTGSGGVAFSTDAPSSLYVLSTTAGAVDILTMKYNATAARWWPVSLIRGF